MGATADGYAQLTLAAADAVVSVAPTTSVVVPSFGRPEFLRGCLAALANQTQLPGEVVVAARRGDDETARTAGGVFSFPVRLVVVDEPGHLPPIVAGVEAATGEIVLLCDDDAEPWPEWVERLARHYDDPTIGGAGGRVVQPGFEEHVPTNRVGRISWSGRFDRLHHHRLPAEGDVRDVHALRGTNMSFRRDLLLRYPWDGRLNRGAATDYEIALCAWVRSQRRRIVFDPGAAVTHHVGPRPEIGRQVDERAIRDYSHNLVYVSATALPRWQRPLAVAGAFLVGSRQSYGVASALADLALGRPPSVHRQLAPAFQGKLEGLRSAFDYARTGPVSPLSPRLQPSADATASPTNAK